MLCRNPPSTLVSLDNTAASPSSSDSTNRDSSLSATTRERKDSEDTITEHDDRNHSETSTFAAKDPKKSTTDDGERNDEKRCRTWSLDSTGKNEVTKKGKMDDDRGLRLESPPQRSRNLGKSSSMDWPEQSTMELSHSCNGDEKRCTADQTHTSSSSSGSREEQQEHDHLALLSGSFDTISVCHSDVETMQEQIIGVTKDSLLSPRQKMHTPTDEDTIALLSPKRKSTNPLERNCTPNAKIDRHPEREHGYNSSLGTKDEDGNHYQRYRDDSPHSPPQRIIHVDGDDNGCGDISPIKFSPPTDSPTDSPPPESEKPNFNSNHRYEHPKAAEVSFDNSSGYQRGHKKESTKLQSSRVSRMRREEEEDKDRRLSSYSEVKTPPRRVTSKSPSTSGTRSTKQSYKPAFSMAPPIPRDLNRPHVIASYYPRHPPVMAEGNHPHGDTTLQRDQSKGYYHGRSVPFVRSGNSSRANFSSPIRPSRQPYRRSNSKENSHPHYRERTPTKYESPYNGRQWMGRGYSSTPREYPAPRAHLPPHSNPHYWHPNHNLQHPQYPHYPTQEIASHGHSKDMRGIPPMPSLTDKRSHYYHPQPIPSGPHPQTPTSNSTLVPVASPKDPFILIRSIRKIFQGCSYLLCPVNLGVQWGESHQAVHTDPEDLKVARRRIESAICALGGYIKEFQAREDSPSPPPSSSSLNQSTTPTSVFRRRLNYYYRRKASMYRNQFHKRYFVGDHGVSWEVEENPPITISVDEEDSSQSRNGSASRNNDAGMPKSPTTTNLPKQEDESHKHSMQSDSFLVCQSISSHVSRMQLNQLQQQKMKYRCKLCGQPKQNHVCPYRKSLVRTLGIMVCPAVNAYNSAEPGVLTPPLSEMNNFVPYGRRHDGGDFDNEVSPQQHVSSSSYIVTPGGSRNDRVGRHHSPATSSSSASPHSASRHFSRKSPQEKQQRGQMPTKNLWQQQKPCLEFRQEPLFMTLALRPEHYRAVTPRAPYRNGSSSGKAVDERDDKEEIGSYEYPNVPITFLGRKRLTDTLFYLSQSIPSVTADVASLLRMARERDEWDLAVSEVLTQVVVCIYCSDGDYRLDGLKNYLLKIGIAS